jgi:hypothetical protein
MDLAHEYFVLLPPGVESCFGNFNAYCSAGIEKHQRESFCAYHGAEAGRRRRDRLRGRPLCGGRTLRRRQPPQVGKGQASAVNCGSSTECTFLTPSAKAVGTVDVIATVNGVNSAKSTADHFTYS